MKARLVIRKMELLNSEGPLLWVLKHSDEEYVVYDKEDGIVDILTQNEIQSFVHGNLVLNGEFGPYKYSEYPGDMKPDLKKLDEFIGIDTTSKTY